MEVQFTKKLNGYDKKQVSDFIQSQAAELQAKQNALAESEQKVAALTAKLNELTGGDETVLEKATKYDNLMSQMAGDYKNLLAPAVAKAAAIQKKAEEEYAVRIDQAKYSAEGIYDKAAVRIGEAVDENMDRMYALIDEFLYKKTLPGRLETLFKGCKALAGKIADGFNNFKASPSAVVDKIKTVPAKAGEAVKSLKNKIVTKFSPAAAAADDAEEEIAEDVAVAEEAAPVAEAVEEEA